jgi:hypothetical protein
VLWFDDRLVVPKDQELKNKLMDEAHLSKLSIYPSSPSSSHAPLADRGKTRSPRRGRMPTLSAMWRPVAPTCSTSNHRARALPPFHSPARSLPSSFLWRTERKEPLATARHCLLRRVPTTASHRCPIAYAQCSATFSSPPNMHQ